MHVQFTDGIHENIVHKSRYKIQQTIEQMREEIDHTLGQEMDLEIDEQEVYVFSLSCQLCV